MRRVPILFVWLTRPQVYLQAAKDYLLDQEDGTSTIESIKGVWVASNDPTVVYEVRALVHYYFPNVEREHVVFAPHGMKTPPKATAEIPTHTGRQVCVLAV